MGPSISWRYGRFLTGVALLLRLLILLLLLLVRRLLLRLLLLILMLVGLTLLPPFPDLRKQVALCKAQDLLQALLVHSDWKVKTKKRLFTKGRPIETCDKQHRAQLAQEMSIRK
jgi:hypothetical protein